MTTIIFYNLTLLISTLFVWLSEKKCTKFQQLILLSVAFLLVFLPSAIRYDVGTDYLSYLRIFESGSYISYQIKEPAFYFVNWFFDVVNLPFQWVFATFSLIFTSIIFISYPKKNKWLLHFLFFSMLWFPSFNIIRQSIAISWCLLALLYYFDKRYVWFFLFTIIGSFFHQSALIIALIGGIALIPIPLYVKTRIAPVFFLIILVITFFSMNILLYYIDILLDYLGLVQYSAYFHSANHFIDRNFGTGLGALVKALFSFYIISNSKYYIQKNKQYWLLIVLVFFYALGIILASKIVIFGRMADVFIAAQILGAYYLWFLPKNRTINKLIVFVFLLFLFLTFLKVSFGVPTSYADPKLNPFQTIFNRDL